MPYDVAQEKETKVVRTSKARDVSSPSILKKQKESSQQKGIELQGEYVHTPNPARVGSDKAVPLSGGQFADGGRLMRRDDPTTVTVVFDKFEALDERLFPKGIGSAVISPPEDVTLIKGDELVVIQWHDSKWPLKLGFRVEVLKGKAKFDSSKKPTRAKGAGPKTSFVPDGTVSSTTYYAGTLKGIGGSEWHLRVLEVGEEGYAVVRLQEFAQGSGEEKVESYKTLVERGEKTGYHMHQQGQFYGGYSGMVSLKKGEKKKIAAPGTQSYHLSEWEGHKSPMGKQAAYWVPINVVVHNKDAQDGTLKVSNLKFVNVAFNNKHSSSGTCKIRAGESVDVGITFLGGAVAETEIEMV